MDFNWITQFSIIEKEKWFFFLSSRFQFQIVTWRMQIRKWSRHTGACCVHTTDRQHCPTERFSVQRIHNEEKSPTFGIGRSCECSIFYFVWSVCATARMYSLMVRLISWYSDAHRHRTCVSVCVLRKYPYAFRMSNAKLVPNKYSSVWKDNHAQSPNCHRSTASERK